MALALLLVACAGRAPEASPASLPAPSVAVPAPKVNGASYMACERAARDARKLEQGTKRLPTPRKDEAGR